MILGKTTLTHVGTPFRATEVVIPWAEFGPGVIALVGANGCLAGDTLIDVPRDLKEHPGGIPIRDLVGTQPWVYAYDGERIVLTRAVRVWCTGIRPVLRVRFTRQRGKRGGIGRYSPPGEIVGTAEHPVMLRDGTYRALGALQPGDRLMPLYRRCRDGKYAWINRNDGTMVLEHRLVAEALLGRALAPGEHVHHLDHNTENNGAANLVAMWARDHGAHHGRLRPPHYDTHPRGMMGKAHALEARARIGAAIRRRNRDQPELPQRAGKAAGATWRLRNPRPWHDPLLLHGLYIEEQRSTVEIGEILGTSDVVIGHWLRQHGIPVRSLRDAQFAHLNRRQANHRVLSVELLHETEVFDVEVPDHHNFVANGVVVHNSGKSTLLEASLTAPLYRQWAYYGLPFPGLIAPGVRDARVEIEFRLGGRAFRAVVQADPQYGGGRGKQEAYLYELGTSAPPAGPNVRDFDAAVARILPPLELMLASVFAAQGRRGAAAGFFGLSRSDRRNLFVQMLGIERFQALSQGARAHAEAAVQALDRTRQDLETQRAQAARALALAARGTELAGRVQTLQGDCAQHRATVELGTTALAAVREALAGLQAQLDAVRQRNAERRHAAEAARAEHVTLVARLAAGQAILDRAAEIDAAGAALPEIIAAVDAAQHALDAAAAEVAPLQTRQAAAGAALEAKRGEHRRLEAELAAARAAAERIASHGEQVAREIAAGEARLQELEERKHAAEARYEALGEAAVAEEARVAALAQVDATLPVYVRQSALLGQIEAPEADLCRRCPLTADARTAGAERQRLELERATLVAQAPAEDPRQARAAALQAFRDAEDIRRDAESRLAVLRPQHAALEADRAAAAREPELGAAVAGIVAAGKALRAEGDALAADLHARRTDRERIWAERDRLRRAREVASARAAEAPALAAARTEHETLIARRPQLEEVMARGDTREAEPDVRAVEEQIAQRSREVAGARAALASAEEALAAAQQEAARLRGEQDAIGDAAADVTRLEVAEAATAEALADWRLLERDLGPDGLQALEIELAGPSVTAVANRLLEACYGSRFALVLETLAERKTGGGQREVFEARLIDAETGRTGTEGSGGEQVILDEALRLALAIYNGQRSGVTLQTLWRDEVTGPLDPDHARRYVAMLREAQRLGGFHQVILIAHSQDVWELADQRILVADGGVTFDPPLAAAQAA
jgi:exonuclease SbcC